MSDELARLLARMDDLVTRLDALDTPIRDEVVELLDSIDILHRSALGHLGDALGGDEIARLRTAHPAVDWLFDAYAVGIDERGAAEAALARVRPFIHSHGGEVQVLGVQGGIVSLRMGGSCSGCTASAVTLRDGIEEALREHLPGFVGVDVEEDHAAPHAPPTALPLVQITAPPV